jgi:ankyrin repeat protein
MSLYRLGANINTADNDGTTPAFIAAVMGHERAIRVLHELGADRNTPRNSSVTQPQSMLSLSVRLHDNEEKKEDDVSSFGFN